MDLLSFGLEAPSLASLGDEEGGRKYCSCVCVCVCVYV